MTLQCLVARQPGCRCWQRQYGWRKHLHFHYKIHEWIQHWRVTCTHRHSIL